LASLVVAALLLGARPASAQVHWDMNVHAGVARRFFDTGLPEGGTLGPMAGVAVDVAMIPLIRLGGYVDYEYAYTGEPASPHAISFGLRLKVEPPVNFGGVHFYGFAGFGGAQLVAPGYDQILPGTSPDGVQNPVVHYSATTGTVLEVPFGVGAGWRFARPWELLLELQGRLGVASLGDYFSDTGRPGDAQGYANPGKVIGTDTLGVFATIGIGFDR
jgi:hypothetical protein